MGTNNGRAKPRARFQLLVNATGEVTEPFWLTVFEYNCSFGNFCRAIYRDVNRQKSKYCAVSLSLSRLCVINTELPLLGLFVGVVITRNIVYAFKNSTYLLQQWIIRCIMIGIDCVNGILTIHCWKCIWMRIADNELLWRYVISKSFLTV